MSDDQLVFLLGLALALYAYKPFVNIVTSLLAFLKLRIHKQRLYDLIESILKDKENYSTMRQQLTVKRRSYIHNRTLLNKNLSVYTTYNHQ